MQSFKIPDILDQPKVGEKWLSELGVTNVHRGHANLITIAQSGMTLDLVESLCLQLEKHLPGVSDPDRALNNLERFIESARSGLAIGALLDREPTGLPILLTIFSTSQYLSDILAQDSESYDFLRRSEGQLHTREALVDELSAETETARQPQQAMAILRRFKRRETFRIAFGDLIVGHRIEEVTKQISYLADAICTCALNWTARSLSEKWGVPQNNQGVEAGFAILALGKLGGEELNYSSDIDLVMIYEADGETTKSKSNREYFERLTRDTVKLLNETTSLGAAYRVDLRLRPQGKQGRICHSVKAMLQYYDLQGRTWERQAFIKARTIAGDLDLGNQFLGRMQHWIYRRNLRRAEIGGIKSLKRQIERRARVEGEERTNVKTGHGGIRDVEFVIQFLQLLNGGVLPEVRAGNTLDAIRQLESAGCLTNQEASLLANNYCWLRKLEHRLQLMFDLQTHTLPDDEDELEKTARRMGYKEYFGDSELAGFKQDLEEITASNRQILNHLLHLPFGGEEDEEVPLIVDVVLQPDASDEVIEEALLPYGFKDSKLAYQNLCALAKESTVFLSAQRCRHFLAAVAPRLLTAIAETPDPQATLVSLSIVSESLGAKGVLWELFNSEPSTLDLYVRLCAHSDYLAGILKSNPGMIDELIDSLQMTELPKAKWLSDYLDDLKEGAEDTEPIYHSFKNTQHLRVGIRDVLGRDPIRETHRSLGAIAETCLQAVTRDCYESLLQKHVSESNLKDWTLPEKSGFVIVAMGKLGGREPNYHSDLDVIFIYRPCADFEAALKDGISSQYFFSDLSANITKRVTTRGRFGRLYELDSRLRPTGKSGALAVSVDEFKRYFESGEGQTWERLALCKARPVFGSEEVSGEVMDLVYESIAGQDWTTETPDEIYNMRFAMQEGSTPRNLKRGVGGTVDIEFMVQMLQLKHSSDRRVIVPGTIEAIEVLMSMGLIEKGLGQKMIANYGMLRSVEARLRLMNTTSRHDLPVDDIPLRRLADLLGYDRVETLQEKVSATRAENRELFEAMFAKMKII